jgi:AhpD family alkylhydroperoxidase
MSATRIPMKTDGALVGAISWWTRRAYGDVMEPALVLAHNRKVLMTALRFQRAVEKWDALDDKLKHLATLTAAATIGCSWCLDFGYWVSHSKGVDPAKLEAITHWRTADVYSPVERLVIEYAEAMSVTPPAVTDELMARLREHLSDAAVVELTAVIALENEYSRTNAALGVTSQGFQDRCELRPVHG